MNDESVNVEAIIIPVYWLIVVKNELPLTSSHKSNPVLFLDHVSILPGP